VFSSCTNLASITLPSGITSIGTRAFSGCTRLASITLPASLISIYAFAFNGCTRLASITLPSGLTTIGNNAFSGCTTLTSINIPNNVIFIGSCAFSNSGLRSITWPAQPIIIGYRMFYGCTNLQTVVISEGVIKIEKEAFIGCTALTSVTLPTTIWRIEAAFNNCPSLTTLNIPAALEWIELAPNAFSSATKLTLVSQAALKRFENAPEAVRQQAAAAAQQRVSALIGSTAVTANTVSVIGYAAPVKPGTFVYNVLGYDQWYWVQVDAGTLTVSTDRSDLGISIYNSSLPANFAGYQSFAFEVQRLSVKVPAGIYFISIGSIYSGTSSAYNLQVEFNN